MADISRAEALALMAEDRAPEIIQEATKQSVALATFRKINMGKKEKVIPFLDVLPATPSGGPFINGDTGIKPTLDMSWTTKTMYAEEIAGIAPIPENVLEDSDVDLWSELRPRLVEYVAYSIDKAVFSGINAPPSWPAGGLVQVATDAGNVVDLSNYLASGTLATGFDLAGAFNELLGLVEDDGFDAAQLVAKKSVRRSLRNLRDTTGEPVLQTTVGQLGASVPAIWDTPLSYVLSGNESPFVSTTLALALDPKYAIIGTRQDMTWKLLDQATLTDGAGNVVTSLAEQDMLALRFKIRLGFTYLDPTTLEGGSGASPFAVLVA